MRCRRVVEREDGLAHLADGKEVLEKRVEVAGVGDIGETNRDARVRSDARLPAAFGICPCSRSAEHSGNVDVRVADAPLLPLLTKLSSSGSFRASATTSSASRILALAVSVAASDICEPKQSDQLAREYERKRALGFRTPG